MHYARHAFSIHHVRIAPDGESILYPPVLRLPWRESAKINYFIFLLSALAVWRVTHLLQAEDGPFDVIFKIRKSLGNGLLGSLMDCFYCLSLWVALPFGLYAGSGWLEKVLYWLALSAGAIIIQNLFIKDKNLPSE